MDDAIGFGLQTHPDGHRLPTGQAREPHTPPGSDPANPSSENCFRRLDRPIGSRLGAVPTVTRSLPAQAPSRHTHTGRARTHPWRGPDCGERVSTSQRAKAAVIPRRRPLRAHGSRPDCGGDQPRRVEVEMASSRAVRSMFSDGAHSRPMTSLAASIHRAEANTVSATANASTPRPVAANRSSRIRPRASRARARGGLYGWWGECVCPPLLSLLFLFLSL